MHQGIEVLYLQWAEWAYFFARTSRNYYLCTYLWYSAYLPILSLWENGFDHHMGAKRSKPKNPTNT